MIRTPLLLVVLCAVFGLLQLDAHAQSPTELRIASAADFKGWEKLHLFAHGQLSELCRIPRPHTPELSAYGDRLERELNYASWGMLAIGFRMLNRSASDDAEFHRLLDRVHEEYKRLYVRYGELVEELSFVAAALSDDAHSAEARAALQATHRDLQAAAVEFRAIHFGLTIELATIDSAKDKVAKASTVPQARPSREEIEAMRREQTRKSLAAAKRVLQAFLAEFPKRKAAAEARYVALDWRTRHPSLAAAYARRFEQ
ncbi:MAG: hypothetical protein KDD44_13680 [Bdellovibrionales bacterium]|nr:hypothetical protein [Bdellovibrionales bacterium]